MVGLQAEQPPDGGADGAAVADDDQGAVLGKLVGVVEDHRCGPVGDLGLQFAPTAAHRLTALPGGVLLAVAGEDLVVRQPLPGPRVGLPQRRVVGDLQARQGGQLTGRGRRPLEVGGDDGVRAQAREQPGGPPRLGEAGLRQLDVRAALEAALQIPGRLAVPPQDDAAALGLLRAVQDSSPSSGPVVASAWAAALPRVALASSGRSSSGQSFHRRSSA